MASLLPHICIEPEQEVANASFIGLHGLGADGYDFQGIASMLSIENKAWNFRWIFPHAPQLPITINGGLSMPAWFDILSADSIRRVNHQHIQNSLAQLLQFIKVENERGVENDRIIISGFSQGACMALALLTANQAKGERVQNSKNYAAIIALSGRALNDREIKDDEYIPDAKEIPIFMAHGREDDVLPFHLAHSSARLMKEKKFNIEFHGYKNLAHSVDQNVIIDLNHFLNSKIFFT